MKALIILAFALAGWAWCGAIMGLGSKIFSMRTTLVLHALGAPMGFGLLSWLYHAHFGYTQPLLTASIFLGVVVLLDVFVVAMAVQKSFDMFRSFLGTWLPFALIFASTYLAGTMAAG